MEELRDDGGHAAKVSGAGGAVEAIADAGNLDEGGGAGRVHFGVCGGEEEVDAGFSQQRAVGVEGAWVAAEVLAGRELQGIDEERGGHDGALCARGLYKR